MSARSVWWVSVLVAIVWFGTLGQRALLRPDEGRYAEIPREMVASGDWLTPRLNGIKYFEKPALQYWATAAGFELFGESEWTARLWPAITGFLAVLLAGWTGCRLWGAQAGLMATAVLASCLLFVGLSHFVTLDMGLTFFLQGAWTAFIFAQREEGGESRKWMLLAWISAALAVLSKGLVALVLLGGALLGYTLLNRDRSPWRKLQPIAGPILFLAVAAPWFVAVSLANPEFPRFFFVHEHFERFLTTVHSREQPGWYFLAIYALGAFPWTLLLLPTLYKAWKQGYSARFSPERFLLVWVLSTFVFFSLSSSKMAPYLLPIFPALALMGGRYLCELSRRSWLTHLGILATVAAAALVAATRVAALTDDAYTQEMLQGLAAWLVGAAALLLLGIVAAATLVWRKRILAAAIALGLGGLLSASATLVGYDHLASYKSAKGLAAAAGPQLKPGAPFYSVLTYEHTLPFYLKRTMTLVQTQSEMEFGLVQEPQRWIPSVERFAQRWRQDDVAYAVMTIDNFEKLLAGGLPMREIARNRQCVLVEKVPAPLVSHAAACSPTVGSSCEGGSDR